MDAVAGDVKPSQSGFEVSPLHIQVGHRQRSSPRFLDFCRPQPDGCGTRPPPPRGHPTARLLAKCAKIFERALRGYLHPFLCAPVGKIFAHSFNSFSFMDFWQKRHGKRPTVFARCPGNLGFFCCLPPACSQRGVRCGSTVRRYRRN